MRVHSSSRKRMRNACKFEESSQTVRNDAHVDFYVLFPLTDPMQSMSFIPKTSETT